MTLDTLDHYRRLIEIHEDLRDPLVMIKVNDLRALLDCFEWYADPTTKPVTGIKLKDGKLVRVRKFDASKARRIAKSKTQRIVSPAKARAAR